MRIAFEYGFVDTGLEDIINRRMRDGWFLAGPPQFHWNAAGEVSVAVAFCDEPPYDNWVGPHGVQRVGATWEA